MVCKKCGLQNAEGNRFCIVCGTPLEETSEVTINPNIESSQSSSVQVEEETGIGIDIFNRSMTGQEQNNVELEERQITEEIPNPGVESNPIPETEISTTSNAGIPEINIPTQEIDSNNVGLEESQITEEISNPSVESNPIPETEISTTPNTGIPEMSIPTQEIDSMNAGLENQETANEPSLVEENQIANNENDNQSIENIENYISQEDTKQQNNSEIKLSETPLKDKPSKSVHYFSVIGKFLGKPISTIQEQINNFTMKNSIIIMVLTSIIAVLFNFVVQAINTIKETTIDWNNGGTTIEWNFENLKELNYIDILLKNWVYILIVILVLTAIYYIVALFSKRKIKVYPILSLISLSILPTVITTFVLFPIIGEFSLLIAIMVLFIGVAYSNLILILGINEIVVFEKLDSKIYYQLVCAILISIIVCLMLNGTINTLSSMLAIA